MACNHQHLIRIPRFPGDAWVCRDCGDDRPQSGYINGIRDYYIPGDPTWRRRSEIAKLGWLADEVGDELEQCPGCLFAGTLDDFDVMGADAGHLFCNQCGIQFEQEPVEATQTTLF